MIVIENMKCIIVKIFDANDVELEDIRDKFVITNFIIIIEFISVDVMQQYVRGKDQK